MKKIDTLSPTFAVAPTSSLDLKPAPRLIVLVPESEIDSAILARKIREAANAMESRVQLIGLSRDPAHAAEVRRRLVTLSAMVEDKTIFVEKTVEFGANWLNAVKPYWRENDVIVCFAGQRNGLAVRPLDQVLQSNLKATVYVIAGVIQKKERARPSWMSNLLAWSGSIVFILMFFWLQISLSQPPHVGLRTLLLYVSLVAEGGSIWAWNSFFS